MNILYLSDVSLDIIGGAQTSMKIVKDNIDSKFEIFMLTPRNSELYHNVIELESFDDFVLKRKKTMQIINLILKIKKVIQEKKIDIIHVQMPSTMIIIGLMKYLKLINKPIIYTDRGVLDKYGNKTYWAIKKFNKYFSKIICTTTVNKNKYINILGVKNEKIEVIPNTAGDLFEIYDEKLVSKMKSNLWSNNGLITLMFAGRWCLDKNWSLCENIICELSKNHKFNLIIALGSDKSERGINECREFIEKIKENNSNINLKSFIDIGLAEMDKLYYATDVFILTSKTESFGRTAIEAMSRANLVYGTKVDGLIEVIGDDDFLYNNIEEFLNKISKNEINSKSKELFLSRYKNNYSIKNNIKKHELVYRLSEKK